MVDFGVSGLTHLMFQWVIKPLFWLIIIIIFFGGTLLILFIRKKRRLYLPTVEIVDLGNNKLGYNFLKSGWMGKKVYAKGLWWRGEEVLRTDTLEIIEDFSTTDYQEVNSCRGVVCYRNPLRQNILVPINKGNVTNKELVAAIAPSNYSDAAIDIIRDATTETNDWRDKLIQFGGYAVLVLFSLVSIIIIIQYVKSSQNTAAELLMNAGTTGADACRDICANAISLARGG